MVQHARTRLYRVDNSVTSLRSTQGLPVKVKHSDIRCMTSCMRAALYVLYVRGQCQITNQPTNSATRLPVIRSVLNTPRGPGLVCECRVMLFRNTHYCTAERRPRQRSVAKRDSKSQKKKTMPLLSDTRLLVVLHGRYRRIQRNILRGPSSAALGGGRSRFGRSTGGYMYFFGFFSCSPPPIRDLSYWSRAPRV